MDEDMADRLIILEARTDLQHAVMQVLLKQLVHEHGAERAYLQVLLSELCERRDRAPPGTALSPADPLRREAERKDAEELLAALA